MVWYLKVCHRPMIVDPNEACKPDDSFRGIISFFFFSFLIYMMPKICSQGYHFSVAVCKTGELRGFIFLTHHTKTMSCRIVVSNWEDWGWAHPPILRPPSKDRIMLQVRDPLLLSVSTLTAFLKSQYMCVGCRDYCMSLLYLWLV